MSAGVRLPADLRALMDRGISVIVGSRDAAMRPSLMRAVGSRLADDGSVTVFLSRSQSRQLLQDIAATGHVAVVFSVPASHRTVQLKASRAAIRPADESDGPALARYLASMEHEVGRVGFQAPFIRAFLAHRVDDLVAVTFVPEQAFDQTPGPQAGSRLEARP